MKAQVHSSIWHILIALVIAGCAMDKPGSTATPALETGVTPVATVRQTREAIDGEWALQRECAPPCWHGITPGATTREQARQILQSTPQFTDIREYETLGGFSWRLSGPPQPVDDTKPVPMTLEGEATYRAMEDDEVISSLSIPLRSRHDLGAIIDYMGVPPSHVLVMIDLGNLPTDRPEYAVRVLWLDMGLDFLQFGVTPMEQDMRSIEFNGEAHFFETNVEAWVRSWGGSLELVRNNVVPWKDSYSFWDYCLHAASIEALDRGACNTK